VLNGTGIATRHARIMAREILKGREGERSAVPLTFLNR